MSEQQGGGWSDVNTYASIGQGASNLGVGIASILAMTRETGASKQARHAWQNMQQPAADLLSQLYQNPYAESRGVPYSPKTAYKWAPTQATQSLYANYLNRQYGLPSSVAQSMVAQSLQPVRIGSLRAGTSSANAMSGSAIKASALANAAMGTQAPKVMRAQDYLQNAGKLAAYNTWRAQQLGQVIG